MNLLKMKTHYTLDYKVLRVKILLPFGETLEREVLEQYMRSDLHLEPLEFGSQVSFYVLQIKETPQGNEFETCVFFGGSTKKMQGLLYPLNLAIAVHISKHEKKVGSFYFESESKRISFESLDGELIEYIEDPLIYPKNPSLELHAKPLLTDICFCDSNSNLADVTQKRMSLLRHYLLTSSWFLLFSIVSIIGFAIVMENEQQTLKNELAQLNSIRTSWKAPLENLDSLNKALDQKNIELEKSKPMSALLFPWDLALDEVVGLLPENSKWTQFKLLAPKKVFFFKLELLDWKSLDRFERAIKDLHYIQSLKLSNRVEQKNKKVKVQVQGSWR